MTDLPKKTVPCFKCGLLMRWTRVHYMGVEVIGYMCRACKTLDLDVSEKAKLEEALCSKQSVVPLAPSGEQSSTSQ